MRTKCRWSIKREEKGIKPVDRHERAGTEQGEVKEKGKEEKECEEREGKRRGKKRQLS